MAAREQAVNAGRPAGLQNRGALAMVGASMAIFLALVVLLAVRLAAGADPALRALNAAHPRPRHVVIRRIYERIVITHLPPTAPPQRSSSAQQVSSSGSSEASPPITRAS